MLKGLNHITIAVSDLERSLDFYINALGFKGHVKWRQGAYLSLGDLWLCLSVDKPDEKLLDPDGHKLEIYSGDLYSRLESIKHQPYEGLEWL